MNTDNAFLGYDYRKSRFPACWLTAPGRTGNQNGTVVTEEAVNQVVEFQQVSCEAESLHVDMLPLYIIIYITNFIVAATGNKSDEST